ncbi:MAG: hypothetical protein M1814_002192 [Vezdaea aestivalis]|nr:MAG: hypothetical protein M1814_002192 [Vezdaea aestivalis]
MAPNSTFYASAPTVFLPPAQQPFSTSPTSSFTKAPPSPPQNTPPNSTFISTASRKRSRDDMASPISPVFGDSATFPPLPSNPDSSLQCRSTIQSVLRTAPSTVQDHSASTSSPPVHSIKSTSPTDRAPSINASRPPPLIPQSSSSSARSGPSEPTIDTFTLRLGVGWKAIGAPQDSNPISVEEDHVAAAARGWARYIENHYPLNSVRILLQSSGLSAYLVESQEGFFLFHEDLGEGRLVAKRFEDALDNLTCVPTRFEGPERVLPVGTPSFSPGVVDTPKEEMAVELEAIEEESGAAQLEFRMDMD